ncbi:hypothetical protein Tco_0578315 [Tanacetum coccineum]
MKYLPKRRWSTMEKKMDNIMIKSDTKVFTMTMEILLEPTSNKLLVGDLCDSIRIKLVTTGKKRWSILTDSKEYIKMDVEQRSVKVKELQERCIIKAFKLSYQEKYEHVGPKSQDHKMARLQDDVKRLCLINDLKKFKITFISSQRYNSKPKVKDYYNISQVNN